MRRAIVYLVALLTTTAPAYAADCRFSAEEMRDYAAEHAAGAEVTVIDGMEADRFRVIFNSFDPVDTKLDEVYHVTKKADEVRVYWMGELAHVQIYSGECAPLAHTFEAPFIGWLMYRLRPDEWPVPEEYRSDGL